MIFFLKPFTAFSQNDSVKILFKKNGKTLNLTDINVSFFIEEEVVSMELTDNYLHYPEVLKKSDLSFDICICTKKSSIYINKVSTNLFYKKDLFEWIFEVDKCPFNRKKPHYNFIKNWKGIKYIYTWMIIPEKIGKDLRVLKAIYKKDLHRLKEDCKCK